MLKTFHIWPSRRHAACRFSVDRRGVVAGIATIILLLYATIVVASSCLQADLGGSVQENRRASMTTENHDDSTAERLCQSLHEHLLAVTPAANDLNTISLSPPLLLIGLINEGLSAGKRPLNEWRPPGSGLLSYQSNHPLRFILRI